MSARMPCKAIVFDFDGTLADSMPFLEAIGVATMIKYFRVSKTDATRCYRSTTGLPYEQQVNLNFPDADKNDVAIEEFEGLKIERIFEQQLMTDAVAVVERLNEMRIQVFVSSSTFEPIIEEYFQRKGLSHLFKDIVGYRPGFEKGADHFSYIRAEHGIEFEDMVFVGDSLRDQKRAEGICRFIALTGMFSEEDFRRQDHKGPVVQSLSEIPNLVKFSE